MSDTTPSQDKPRDFWWGLGLAVESQSLVVGVNAMIARMQLFDEPTTHCVIRVSSDQVGPGLGAGGDAVLVIGTAIAQAADFPQAIIGGGWHFSFRDGLDLSPAPAAFELVVDMIKLVPTNEITNIAAPAPGYTISMRDAVAKFYDVVIAGKHALETQPHVWIFQISGIGAELGLTYQFSAKAQLVNV